MQHFSGDPDSGKLNLETHRLALAITKNTLDENRFTATQKMLARDKPAFQIGDHVYFKNKQPGKWDLKWRPGYRIGYRVQWTFHPHREPGHRENMILQCHRHHPRAHSSRMLILSLAELATILIILQICPSIQLKDTS